MFIGLLGKNTRATRLGDEPRRALDELKQIRLVDIVLPTRQGIDIRKRCVARPDDCVLMLIPYSHAMGKVQMYACDVSHWLSTGYSILRRPGLARLATQMTSGIVSCCYATTYVFTRCLAPARDVSPCGTRTYGIDCHLRLQDGKVADMVNMNIHMVRG